MEKLAAQSFGCLARLARSCEDTFYLQVEVPWNCRLTRREEFGEITMINQQMKSRAGRVLYLRPCLYNCMIASTDVE